MVEVVVSPSSSVVAALAFSLTSLVDTAAFGSQNTGYSVGGRNVGGVRRSDGDVLKNGGSDSFVSSSSDSVASAALVVKVVVKVLVAET